MTPAAADDVLAFWFGRPGDGAYGRPRQAWFLKDAAFDMQIRERFLADVEAALAGGRGEWAGEPGRALALLILLDQFPRNLFRHDARAFAGDATARALADQDRAVRLFAELAGEDPGLAGYLDYAHRHREVIVRFGRFPHRNAALGRPSTAAEADYLAQPGSGF